MFIQLQKKEKTYRIQPVSEGRHTSEDCWFAVQVAVYSRAKADYTMNCPIAITEAVQRSTRVALKFTLPKGSGQKFITSIMKLNVKAGKISVPGTQRSNHLLQHTPWFSWLQCSTIQERSTQCNPPHRWAPPAGCLAYNHQLGMVMRNTVRYYKSTFLNFCSKTKITKCDTLKDKLLKSNICLN